jgi:hypothetical protein
VGTLTTETQDSAGAFKVLGSGSTAADVSDIGGNADYAIGRWSDGHHYAVFNNAGAGALPVKALTCDSGVYTKPTFDGAAFTQSPNDHIGTATGSATLAFTDSSHASVGLTINVSSPVSSGSGTLTTSISAGAMTVRGFNGGGAMIGSGNNSQAQMYLAVGTGNTYLLATYYQLKLSDASYYTGVAMFTCH